MTSEIDIPFCWHCGSQVKKGKRRISRFNEETGKPIFEYQYKCQSKRWWKRGNGFCVDEWREEK